MNDNSEEGFARRWSRLKRQAPPVELPVPPPAIAAEPPPPIEIPPDAATIPLEDITGWLGRNIPEGWREIALRRMWSADISIRDFIGPADYAWDWNTPGGAPGWGPMRAADDMVRLLARAIGEDLPKPPAEIAVPPPHAPEIVIAAEDPEPPAESPPAVPRQGPEPRHVLPRRGGRATPV
jgi:hypothetical protein